MVPFFENVCKCVPPFFENGGHLGGWEIGECRGVAMWPAVRGSIEVPKGTDMIWAIFPLFPIRSGGAFAPRRSAPRGSPTISTFNHTDALQYIAVRLQPQPMGPG